MRLKVNIHKIMNHRGSSLVLTVILIAVVSVLLVGTHTAVVSYADRINNTYYENQAYLVARSVATAIAEEINSRGEVEKTEINNRIEAFKEEEEDRAQDAKDNNLAYEPDPDDIQAELHERMKPLDPLLKSIYDMTSGDSMTLDEISFTNAGFHAGSTTASISKLVDTDDTVHYTIAAETTIDDKKESVSIELVMSEDENKSSVTTDTIVKDESGSSGGTGGGSGGSSTVTGGISFESNTTGRIFSTGDFTLDNNYNQLEASSIITTGTITLSIKEPGPVRTNTWNHHIYVAPKIVFDLRGSTSDFHLLKSCFSEEIDIYVENLTTLNAKLYLHDQFPIFTNKVTVHCNNGDEFVYMEGSSIPHNPNGQPATYQNVVGKVEGLKDNISYTYASPLGSELVNNAWQNVNARATYDMHMNTITTGGGNDKAIITLPFPDAHLETAREEHLNGADTSNRIISISSDKTYSSIRGVLDDGQIGSTGCPDNGNPSETNPIYIVVAPGATLTLSDLYAPYTFIYVEDGGKLVLTGKQVMCTVYFGGLDAKVFWKELNQNYPASGSEFGNVNSSTTVTTPGTTPPTVSFDKVEVTHYYSQYSYTIDKYVRN